MSLALIAHLSCVVRRVCQIIVLIRHFVVNKLRLLCCDLHGEAHDIKDALHKSSTQHLTLCVSLFVASIGADLS